MLFLVNSIESLIGNSLNGESTFINELSDEIQISDLSEVLSMENVIPRTLKRFESYQTNFYKSWILTRFHRMTRGQLKFEIEGDRYRTSFGLGQRVQAHLRVKNERFFTQFLRGGELGLGESFVNGDWESEDLVALMKWFLINMREDDPNSFFSQDAAIYHVLEGLFKLQSLFRMRGRYSSFDKNISYRYDLNRAFFASFLDESLTYSSAMFDQTNRLEEAQLQKNRRIGQQLKIRPGDHILEIGCGWGSLALYLALSYHCKVTAVTISEEQFYYLKSRIYELQIEDRIIPKLADFRDIQGSYDRIVSVELIDSLVAQDLPNFFQNCKTLLRPQGIMVHQVLLKPENSPLVANRDWIEKYITPGSLTPTLSEFLKAANQQAHYTITELHDMTNDYAITTSHWLTRFRQNLESIKEQGFDDSFLRTWEYYLAYIEAAFSLGILNCAQISMARPGAVVI